MGVKTIQESILKVEEYVNKADSKLAEIDGSQKKANLLIEKATKIINELKSIEIVNGVNGKDGKDGESIVGPQGEPGVKKRKLASFIGFIRRKQP